MHKKTSTQNLACSQRQIHTVHTCKLLQAKTTKGHVVTVGVFVLSVWYSSLVLVSAAVLFCWYSSLVLIVLLVLVSDLVQCDMVILGMNLP